jgi:hypothetical protein
MSNSPDAGGNGPTGRPLLPDPCTLLFAVPNEAPAPIDDAGREWTVAHWVHCARRVGHTAIPTQPGRPRHAATYCGDIDVDGLIYQVHRGPRRRILVEYVQSDGSAGERFELEESVWVEPLAPEPQPEQCLWCEFGPPSTLSHAAEDGADGAYVLGVSEYPDGGGRVVSFQLGLDDSGEQDSDQRFDTYCVVLDPGQHIVYGGITECVIEEQTLRLRLSPQAARDLGVDPVLRFRLALDHEQLALVRAGLRRILSAGRDDARPRLLRV